MIVVEGKITDVLNQTIFPGRIQVEDGIIRKIEKIENPSNDSFILPGFIDAHVHIESSMLVPSEFARLAVVHGTVATVSDPHEIGNVLGKEGVRYMISNGNKVPFKFYFGVPSCVPATTFETAGAAITLSDIEELFKKDHIKYLAEMMNWPGVIHSDPEVLAKIDLAHSLNRPVDGHAPGLTGDDAKAYIDKGISTDHECFSEEEALEKLKQGMKILIREGSAAKNFEALVDLLHDNFEMMMFCSDDKHPDNLVEGHINQLVKRAVAKGVDVFKVLTAACVNPVMHYDLEIGLLREGDPADFIVVDNLAEFNVEQTYINGTLVSEKGKSLVQRTQPEITNNFSVSPITADQLEVLSEEKTHIRIITALDGQLITKGIEEPAPVLKGKLVADVDRDILKMVVVNRYANRKPAVAFIRNFGLRDGAIASSVAHDSHNIISVGANDKDLERAINLIIEQKGGISLVGGGTEKVLALPIAGLMSDRDGYWVASQYSEMDRMAKELGSQLTSPFMTLSFMALLVIPSLKLSDKGLFDGDNFVFVPLQYDQE